MPALAQPFVGTRPSTKPGVGFSFAGSNKGLLVGRAPLPDRLATLKMPANVVALSVGRFSRTVPTARESRPTKQARTDRAGPPDPGNRFREKAIDNSLRVLRRREQIEIHRLHRSVLTPRPRRCVPCGGRRTGRRPGGRKWPGPIPGRAGPGDCRRGGPSGSRRRHRPSD